MESQDISTESFSFGRLAKGSFPQIYAHKLQWFRFILRLVASFHLTPNFSKLYWHYFTHHTPSILPDFLSFFLSVAARITWLFLFRDPAAFLHFKRPSRAYRWAVCGTVAMTTVPNGMIHIWALKAALKNDTFIKTGVWTATLATILLVPLAGLVWWMAWRFLLGVEESDEEFEPTVKYGMAVADSVFEPYTDHLPVSFIGANSPQGYLSQAYDEQKLAEQGLYLEQNYMGPEEMSGQVQVEDVEVLEQPSGEENAVTGIEAVTPPRCPTIARFEHMSESHSGPHSWFSYPIFPLILSTYATILLIGLPIWIHEDREYKLREPSLTLKKSLYLPLGMYLLSFYALKHQIRASLFEHFDIQPPPPWKKMVSILPSWFGTGSTFKNRETGEITVYDPGHRAFPWRAHDKPTVIRTRKYLDAFNANPGTCITYWGHSGRILKTDFRFRAFIHRIGFVSIAIYLVCKGLWSAIFYDVPNIDEEVMKHPKTITIEDVTRIVRIVKLWQSVIFSGLWFFILTLVFGLGSMGSMFVLFVRTIWKYVPQEEKDQIIRDQRERERDHEQDRRRQEGRVNVQ
ncbi:hypothetical protein BKA65DRAFT_519646 [Rhexocercosporidium sp. MPI-PUGE-AT-0058]|nr:hypothetical protein BKA65DRAFT_519646 [Rhexocercosporidium sp. MPI-PUGE-AT-0058]